MTSPLPPRLRDTRSIADRLRQDRQNLRQLGVGFVGGRFPPARPLGANAAVGEFEDEEDVDDVTDQIAFENGDSVTATGAGTVTISLSHEPIDGSLHVRWNGLDQPPTEWTQAGQTVTIPDPDAAIVAGDVFTAAYAYYPSDGQPPGVLIDWGSTGPNLAVPEGSMTDYSQPGFDDSGWLSGAAAVGFPTGMHPSLAVDWEPVVTSAGTKDSGVWLRRTFDADGPADLSISLRVDGAYWLYVDGAVVASDPAHSGQAALGPFTHSVEAGSRVVALHVNDDASDPGTDYLYADLFVESV